MLWYSYYLPAMDYKYFVVLIGTVVRQQADNVSVGNNIDLYNLPPIHNRILHLLQRHRYHIMMLVVLEHKNYVKRTRKSFVVETVNRVYYR